MKAKTIGFAILFLAIGLVLGFIFSAAYFGHTISTSMFMLQEKEIFELEEATEKAYYNQPIEVAIWALENYIDTLNRLKEERSSADVENPYFILSPDSSLAIAHARLWKLYKEVNNSEKSRYHLEQAISHGKGLATEEDLIRLLANLDKNRDEGGDQVFRPIKGRK